MLHKLWWWGQSDFLLLSQFFAVLLLLTAVKPCSVWQNINCYLIDNNGFILVAEDYTLVRQPHVTRCTLTNKHVWEWTFQIILSSIHRKLELNFILKHLNSFFPTYIFPSHFKHLECGLLSERQRVDLVHSSGQTCCHSNFSSSRSQSAGCHCPFIPLLVLFMQTAALYFILGREEAIRMHWLTFIFMLSLSL